MLNAAALSGLLSKNSDERLCKRWLLITPNGTLLANSSLATSNARDLKKQVALAALSWQEHQKASTLDDHESDQTRHVKDDLYTLVVESENNNLLIRKLQPQLLLVLEGGVPPRKPSFEPRITAENASGDSINPIRGGDSSLSASLSSKAESSISMASSGVLALHRKRLDLMASAIKAEFDETGFKMPTEGENNYF
jgi:hypothetical protein